MASLADGETRRHPYVPDTYERILSLGALILLGSVLVALAKGTREWHLVTPVVWTHLAVVITAVALTPVMLLRPRGTASHRALGWVWSVAMVLTALASFGIRDINHGRFSFIHLLSVFTLVQVPILVWSARTRNVKRHRRSVRGLVTGALLVAGFFTFPFDRLLGHWLFG